jgi:integrase
MKPLEYRVKTVLACTGERLPMLIGSDGLPLFEPTVFSLTEPRARNRAANTIGNCLRALLVLYLFLDLRRIDLRKRMAEGRLLTMGEVEELVRLCKLPVKNISSMLDTPGTSQGFVSVVSLEKQRQRVADDRPIEIVTASAATRLRCIRAYLRWLVADRASRVETDRDYRSAISASGQFVIDAIEARLPSGADHGFRTDREGLEPEAVAELLLVVDPHSPKNPWRDEHSRYRNELILLWLLHLGLRRGELLGVRISDIDFRKCTAVIARRADDPADPRKQQPNVKTRAREIPLSSMLQDKTRSYVMNYRAVIAGARKHDFLLVATDSGFPLSIPAFAKVFNVLRAKCPNLPRGLFPHLLRHTWNDHFSEEMDKRNVGEETEKKTRSYLMGWSETSGTAATYTRRHIRRKAQEASLVMQNRMINKV